MLKVPTSMNDLEVRAAEAIEVLLRRVSVLNIEKIALTEPGSGFDILAEVRLDNERRDPAGDRAGARTAAATRRACGSPACRLRDDVRSAVSCAQNGRVGVSACRRVGRKRSRPYGERRMRPATAQHRARGARETAASPCRRLPGERK